MCFYEVIKCCSFHHNTEKDEISQLVGAEDEIDGGAGRCRESLRDQIRAQRSGSDRAASRRNSTRWGFMNGHRLAQSSDLQQSCMSHSLKSGFARVG